MASASPDPCLGRRLFLAGPGRLAAILLAIALVGGPRAAAADGDPGAEPTPARHRFPFGVRGLPPLRAPERETWEARRAAIDLGLRWLAARQGPDGGWDPLDLGWNGPERIAPLPGAGRSAQHQIAVHSLALMAFLGAGYAPGLDHPFRATVERAVERAVERTLEGAVD